ncbi:MAG: hypothetical protein E7314_02550 [Clostridiales bacterium]|nr:hypothetical protein [Clostridiales bacterium]
MEFLKNNKFIIIFTIILSAIGYIFLYIKEEKNENILVEIEEPIIEEAIEIVEEIPKIYVDIAGEITNPGVYMLDEGSRVNDLIIMAGGVTKEANLSNVNLASVLSDGIKITIPNKKDTATKNIIQTSIIGNNKSSGVVNINQADVEELTTLSGIGESIATSIVEYRNKNGNFKNKEDIKNVSGIGESKYSKIKDKITV